MGLVVGSLSSDDHSRIAPLSWAIGTVCLSAFGLLPPRILLGPYLEEAPPPRYRQSFVVNLMLKADDDMGIVPSEMST